VNRLPHRVRGVTSVFATPCGRRKEKKKKSNVPDPPLTNIAQSREDTTSEESSNNVPDPPLADIERREETMNSNSIGWDISENEYPFFGEGLSWNDDYSFQNNLLDDFPFLEIPQGSQIFQEAFGTFGANQCTQQIQGQERSESQFDSQRQKLQPQVQQKSQQQYVAQKQEEQQGRLLKWYSTHQQQVQKNRQVRKAFIQNQIFARITQLFIEKVKICN